MRGAQAVFAVPTTSPSGPSTSVKRTFIESYENFVCAQGWACATVPYANGWYLFSFYQYRTYNLSNWSGVGGTFNNQHSNASMRLYNGSNVQVLCIPAGGPDVNWNPIWSIRLSATPC